MLAAIILLTIATAAAGDLISDSRRALQQLVVQNPADATCRSEAVAVLVFPDVVKAGFILNGQGYKGFSSTASVMVATARWPPPRHRKEGPNLDICIQFGGIDQNW